jgi:hypothetical protein
VLSVLLRFTDYDYPFGIFLLLAIVLSVLLRYTDSDWLFGIFLLLAIELSVLLRYTDSDCPFGILDIRILITSLWYLQTRLTHLWLKTYIGLFCVSFGISIKYEELDLTSLYWNHNYTSVITNSVILLGLSNSSRNNRRSAYIWVPNMLLFSPTFCFILTCQTSYSGFTRKPLTSPPDIIGVRVARSLVFCIMFC